MKKYILAAILLMTFALANAQKFVFVKCISGDCQNGNGVAEFTAPPKDKISDSVIYNGAFKDGKMSGEGSVYNFRFYYTGSFENNYYQGYGTLFCTKKARNLMLPDSSISAIFYKWDDDGCNINLKLELNNDRTSSYRDNNEKHKRFWNRSPLKDDWITSHFNEVLASPAKYHPPRYELNVITEKYISAPKGKPLILIAWDCLADRDYYVTASATKNGRSTLMPFAGYVNYQIYSEGGALVDEGPVDRYWKPLKDGKYTFMIKFDQGQIIGDGNLNVDGAVLNCSLRSRRLMK